ncbi:MAG: signal peptide peptidase SppA [Hyphomicrobiales bacterium]|nr:signal peptide peptidase SppA [Hyphomicrobiales bacterium]
MQPPPYEYLAERRLLTRKLSFWRVAAAVVALAAVLTVGWRFGAGAGHSGAHIARIRIDGVIVDDPEMIKLVKSVTASSSVSGVILSISSPGGTTTGAEGLYDELRRMAAKKPTVAVVDGMAASGAYIAAVAADEIVARGNSMVGSIGVLMEMPNASKLLQTVGVTMETIKSSPLKASPNPYEPTSPEARAAIAAMIADSYDWFKKLVQERRHMSDQELAAVDDGRVFTGRQGMPLKLVDRIGGEREAVAWLETDRGVAKGLSVRDWKKPRKLDGFGLLGSAADWLGLSEAADLAAIAGRLAPGRKLDGLAAIWQGPQLN